MPHHHILRDFSCVYNTLILARDDGNVYKMIQGSSDCWLVSYGHCYLTLLACSVMFLLQQVSYGHCYLTQLACFVDSLFCYLTQLAWFVYSLFCLQPVLFIACFVMFLLQLSYDYQFDFEDDQHKIPCNCGAKHCRKWMN